MTVTRTVLQPETATQDDAASASRVPVSMWRVGTVGISAAASAAVGGGGAPAAVSRRNDAFVGGQDVVDHVADAEVVR